MMPESGSELAHRPLRRALVAALAVAALLPQSCFSEGPGLSVAPGPALSRDASLPPPPPPPPPPDGGPGELDATLDAFVPTYLCLPARSNQPLRARSAVTSDAPSAAASFVTRGVLFDRFNKHCGSCHVDQALGGFDDRKVTIGNFAELVDQAAVDAMRENDPDEVMPQGGLPWDQLPQGDPIREYGNLLEKWITAGRPEVLWIEPESTDGPRYVFSKELGESLTNIGSCLPDPATLATARSQMDELDKLFAAATELPLTLSETDLSTFDSEVLAGYGVIAYAPAYPLWSDDAHKLRHVRVPSGQSIRFEEATQTFDIPENTRFYKTFFKEVVDETGEKRLRKIETRLIVSREDNCSVGSCIVTSLMGTYAWNPDETQATLVQDPLRNGKPFGDRLFTYVTDELRAKEVQNDPVELTKVSRHYAIPGKFRCEQCHMGSPSQDAILGFTPLQIHRRPHVEEPDLHASAEQLQGFGVLEEDAPGEDELTQLQRFMDYGLVTNMTSPDQVKSLRDSQASPPRNGFELIAQGYMLGNCSHCHNPRGYPSQKSPALSPALDFLPRPDRGGIFQFPLDRVSPRIRRGADLDIEIPYISPMLHDMPCTVEGVDCAYRKGTGVVDELGNVKEVNIDAPWRSFIFRNVSTPFTYVDDGAFFPHMPLHSSGFDCRAKRLLGDWMVSIPVTPVRAAGFPDFAHEIESPLVVAYQEGTTSSPLVRHETRQRMTAWRASQIYMTCPDTTDIVAPRVVSGEEVTPGREPLPIPGSPVPWLNPIPGRAHWTDADPTDPIGDWLPRRGDWAGVLLKEDPEKIADIARDDPGELAAIDLIERVDLRVTPELRAWALAQRPFARRSLPTEGCSSERTLRALVQSGGPIPRWLGSVTRTENQTWDNRLYEIAPGAQVFTNICKNCHGPVGDGRSSLAATIAELTGGKTRVANLRDGILGPQATPGAARERVFGEQARARGLGTDDLAARYVTWMALGGTERAIPAEAIVSVSSTAIAGTKRKRSNDVTTFSANMLDTARALCASSLPSSADITEYDLALGPDYKYSALLFTNGDAELWESLCAFGQKAPIRMVEYFKPPTGSAKLRLYQNGGNWLYDPDAYGTRPVMTPSGVKEGLRPGEPLGWCLLEPSDPALRPDAEARRIAPESLVNGQPVPYCPDPTREIPARDWNSVRWTVERQQEFALRGAINAGISVFVYLDAIARKEITHAPEYDECPQETGL